MIESVQRSDGQQKVAAWWNLSVRLRDHPRKFCEMTDRMKRAETGVKLNKTTPLSRETHTPFLL